MKSRAKANQTIMTMGGRPKAAPRSLLFVFSGFGPGFHSGTTGPRVPVMAPQASSSGRCRGAEPPHFVSMMMGTLRALGP